VDECPTLNETSCADTNTLQTCVLDGVTGCNVWGSDTDCSTQVSNGVCDSGPPAACVDGCQDAGAACTNPGDTQCSGDTLQTCTTTGGMPSCNVWVDTDCTTAEPDGGCVEGTPAECVACENETCAPGDTQGSGNTLLTCVADGTTGCGDWDNGVDCTDAPGWVGECTPGDPDACTQECAPNTYNCDGNDANGCEAFVPCNCVPGETQPCYDGFPADSWQNGECQQGTQTCQPNGLQWSNCVGQVIPTTEQCTNQDFDCDGVNGDVENEDKDSDGYGVCDGDCCDSYACSSTPELINPGAYEVVGDSVDNDCNQGTSDSSAAPACDAGLASNSNNVTHYARAIDLCNFTTAGATGADKKWGVITSSLSFSRLNGAGSPSSSQRSIRDGFGSNIAPEFGNRIMVMSSGSAADQSDTNPAWVDPEPGFDAPTTGHTNQPADWWNDPDQISTAPGCPAQNTQEDPIMYTMDVRVPTNAQSFTMKMYFMTSEYPEWTCDTYNDIFVTLITSAATNTADNNIAIWDPDPTTTGNEFPIGVNLADPAANPPGFSLFSRCYNTTLDTRLGDCSGAYGSPSTTFNTCTNDSELVGTGMDVIQAPSFCAASSRRTGGGTGWLQMSGNVVPGEVMTLRLAIWDTGDSFMDSVVLLDDFQWNTSPASPGVTPG
jgi:hypothetical protein